MSKVVISIVSWNHAKYLTDALRSIRAQTYPDISVVVVDNGSTDETSNLVRENFPEVGMLRNTRNLGFSRAHNQAIEYARANHAKNDEDIFVLVMNPDIILKEDFIANLLDRVAHRTDIGSAGGKLLRVYEVMDGDMLDKQYSKTIDSTGIRIHKSRRVADRNANEEDSGGFERTGEVFGVSGACVLYRLRALVDVAPDGKYFDEDFFAYQEDVDLAWRLRWRGWKSMYVPTAVAYHYRYLSSEKKRSPLNVIRERRNRSKLLEILSYRNHFLMMVKNDSLLSMMLHLPWIGFEETQKFLYYLLFRPSVLLTSASQTMKQLPNALRKRHRIMKGRRETPKEMRRWFS